MRRVLKPIYKENCNWCKYLLYSVSNDNANCLISNEEIKFTEEVLNNKTCNNFKCCDFNRTLLDIFIDFKNVVHLFIYWLIIMITYILFLLLFWVILC